MRLARLDEDNVEMPQVENVETSNVILFDKSPQDPEFVVIQTDWNLSLKAYDPYLDEQDLLVNLDNQVDIAKRNDDIASLRSLLNQYKPLYQSVAARKQKIDKCITALNDTKTAKTKLKGIHAASITSHDLDQWQLWNDIETTCEALLAAHEANIDQRTQQEQGGNEDRDDEELTTGSEKKKNPNDDQGDNEDSNDEEITGNEKKKNPNDDLTITENYLRNSNTMPKESNMLTLEYFRMLKAKQKRLREEQESIDHVDVKSEGMNCSSQSPHPAKRACADLAAGNARVLKEEDPVDLSTHVLPTEVSKLDPPAVEKSPLTYIALGNAELMSNDTVGFGQEGQDDKEEEIIRRDDGDKADGITEETKDGLQNDDDVNGEEKNDSPLEARRQHRSRKSFQERVDELKTFKDKHGHVRVTVNHDKSLARFCANMRSDRHGRRTGNAIAEDKIKALDEVGFRWGDKSKALEQHIEELPTARYAKDLAE